MTVHQLHYTSCEDGMEEIQGFQISAATPGAPKPLADLAVRSSAYEVGPDFVARRGSDDLSGFPIAFGYLPSGRSAALWQSRYTGADFTGRMGNYFAHALLVEDTAGELGGLLPIDLWRSPVWVSGRPGPGTALPEVRGLPPGSGADEESTRRFLAEPDRGAGLAWLIGAVQAVLTERRGRLVLVTSSDREAALWLAALSRSFPRALSMGISFVTYTARPEDQEVLVSCTTPDVRLPAYGDFTPLDLTDPGRRGDPVSRYAAAVAKTWATVGTSAALDLAERVTPPLAAAELDAFAVVLESTMDLPTTSTPDERLVLDALVLAMDRLAGGFSAKAWGRVADGVQDTGGPRDLTRWAAVLRLATDRGEPVPATLLGVYFIATLSAPEHVDVPKWSPRLTSTDLEDVAEHTVLPAITGDAGKVLLDRLSTRPDLLAALLRVLDRKLVDRGEFRALEDRLTPEVAKVLTRAGARGRVSLLADIVLARHGLVDPVQVLVKASHDEGSDWPHLGAVLWQENPSTDDALRALATVRPDVLVATGLVPRFVDRVLREAEQGKLSHKGVALADALVKSPCAKEIAPIHVAALRAVRLSSGLDRAKPNRNARTELAQALELVSQSPEAIGDRLLGSAASFVWQVAEPKQHGDLLGFALAQQPSRFLAAYRETAVVSLAKENPKRVAAAIVVWESVDDQRIRVELVKNVLPEALGKRGGRFLDKVGESLDAAAHGLGARAVERSGGWSRWWKAWRGLHERRSLFGRLRLRRG